MSDARADHLAACLLDAVADENWSNVQVLLQSHHAPAFRIVASRGIAPVHYAAGMEEATFGRRCIELMLQDSAEAATPRLLADRIDARTDIGETALQVATVWGRTSLVWLLLHYGASPEIRDDDGGNAIEYALREGHFEIVDLFRNRLYEQKRQPSPPPCESSKPLAELLVKNTDFLQLPPPTTQSQMFATANDVKSQLTPTRIPYNYDRTSPYYINITHRDRNRMQRLGRVNLFQLTRDNLNEMTGPSKSTASQRNDCQASVERWRAKVAPILQSIDSNSNDSCASLMPNDCREYNGAEPDGPELEYAPAGSAESAAESEEEWNVCNRTIVVQPANDSDSFIRSPRVGVEVDEHAESANGDADFVYQLTEKYQHMDIERGLALYEIKIKPEIRMDLRRSPSAVDLRSDSEDLCASMASTAFSIPLDYDTDALRTELTQFGAPPGPISSTTKRLYTKRLMKFKRNPMAGQQQPGADPTKMGATVFSVELERTLRSPAAHAEHLAVYAGHISRMVESFQLPKSARQKLREGHLKKSFVYLLIDPRVSENLPCEAACGSPLATWKRFLQSVFYVGKGKNGRPYDHLYDALELYSTSAQETKDSCSPIAAVNDYSSNDAVVPNSLRKAAPGKSSRTLSNHKIRRIHSIWLAGKGVVCRPLFHNIIPTEAFTREAAMIEAIGLQNLTNMKTGEYYGQVRSWTMRERKQLGVALLHKALQVLLADGESQLRPDDLL